MDDLKPKACIELKTRVEFKIYDRKLYSSPSFDTKCYKKGISHDAWGYFFFSANGILKERANSEVRTPQYVTANPPTDLGSGPVGRQ